MTVAVAHQVSETSHTVLVQAVHEAKFRATDLAVLHVVESIDPDRQEAYRLGVSDALENAGGKDPGVGSGLHPATAGPPLAATPLGVAEGVGADLLVIGARRRSPVGKALLGSVAQAVILEADQPVLVVKTPKS